MRSKAFACVFLRRTVSACRKAPAGKPAPPPRPRRVEPEAAGSRGARAPPAAARSSPCRRSCRHHRARQRRDVKKESSTGSFTDGSARRPAHPGRSPRRDHARRDRSLVVYTLLSQGAEPRHQIDDKRSRTRWTMRAQFPTRRRSTRHSRSAHDRGGLRKTAGRPERDQVDGS